MLPPGFVEGLDLCVERGHIDLIESQSAAAHGELVDGAVRQALPIFVIQEKLQTGQARIVRHQMQSLSQAIGLHLQAMPVSKLIEPEDARIQ